MNKCKENSIFKSQFNNKPFERNPTCSTHYLLYCIHTQLAVQPCIHHLNYYGNIPMYVSKFSVYRESHCQIKRHRHNKFPHARKICPAVITDTEELTNLKIFPERESIAIFQGCQTQFH